MKKRLSALILCMLMLLPLSALAETEKAVPETDGGVCGENLTWTVNTKTGVLSISGSGAMSDYAVGEPAPWYRPYYQYIKTIVLSDGVTHIGNRAFGLMWEAESCNIPDTVESIGECAFAACYKLKSLDLPDTVTTLGMSAFSECYGMSRITLSKNLTDIPMSAFYRCYALKDIALPSGITRIHYGAFQECTGLETISFPEALESIDEKAFQNCSALQELVLPDCTFVWSDAFEGCIGLKSVTLPCYRTQSIRLGAYLGACTSVTSVQVTPGSDNISYGILEDYFEDSAFFRNGIWADLRECRFSAVLDSGITKIGSCTFYGCKYLNSITIPASLTWIREKAFCGCDGLKDVYYQGTRADFEEKLASRIESGNEALLNATWHFYPDFVDIVDPEIVLGNDVLWKGTTPYVIYNGHAQTPSFTVKNRDGSVIDPYYYDVSYTDNTQPGTAHITVTFKSDDAAPCTAWFKIYLPATNETAVSNGPDGICLSWAPVEGAKGYVIYRRAWNLASSGWTEFKRWNNTTETTWTDTTVYAGTRYQYGVKAYFSDPMDNYNLGEVGPLKTTVRITTRELLGVDAGVKKMTARWSGSKYFTGYQIKYSTDPNFKKDVTAIKITHPDVYRTTIRNLKSGTTYYVTVRSYHEIEGMTYFGEWSNVLSCKVN